MLDPRAFLINSKTGRVVAATFVEFLSGNSTNPSICFTDSPDSGLQCDNAGTVNYVKNGINLGELGTASNLIGGSDTQIQFNNSGSFGGSADLTWDDTGKELSVGGDINSQNVETTGVFSVAGGAAATPSITFTGDLNTGIYSPGADQVAISTNGAGRLFVDASGKVGIGTSTPLGQAEIRKSSDVEFYLTKTGNGSLILKRIDEGVVIESGAGNSSLRNIIFQTTDGTTASERLRITSDGNVGLGTSSPSSLLTVAGTALINPAIQTGINAATISAKTTVAFNYSDPGSVSAGDGIALSLGMAGRGRSYIASVHPTNSKDGTDLAFFTQNSGTATINEALRIDRSGNVGIGTTSVNANLEIASSSAPVLRLSNTDTTLDVNQKTASIEFWTNDADAPNKVFAEIYGEYQFANGYAHNLNYKGYQHVFERVTDFSGTTSESLRIDGSGRLLVGTSTTSTVLTALFQGNSNNPGGQSRLYLTLGGTDIVDQGVLSRINFGDASHNSAAEISAIRDGGTWTSGSSMPGALVFSSTPSGSAAPVERMRITSDAYVRLASGTGGIQFNGDTAAANALDDYEEGTFTPIISGKTTGGTGTYSAQVGRYIKIGKQVTVWVKLVWSAHTGTGDAIILSLPFTSQAISGGQHPFAATVGYETNYDVAANTVLSAYVEPNGTRIQLAQTGVGTQSGASAAALDTAAGLTISATYETA